VILRKAVLILARGTGQMQGSREAFARDVDKSPLGIRRALLCTFPAR